MTTYSTNFSGYTTDAQPSDWTARWVTADNSWLVRADAVADGGKALENTGTVDGRHFLSWDAVDADVNRADVEILALVRSSGTSANQFKLTARGSGAAGAETGYSLSYPEFLTTRLQMVKYVAGVATSIGPVATLTSAMVANTLYYVRFRVSGSDLMAKVWKEVEPEPDWMVTVTDTAITDPGWVGVGNFESSGTRNFDFVSFGTGGDTAPFVSTASTEVRTSQALLETAYSGTAQAVLSQAVLEVGYVNAPSVVASQVVIEVAFINGTEVPVGSTQQPKMVTMF